MRKFIRNNLKIELSTLFYGETLTQSSHFVLNFTKILKNRVFCVLCQPFSKLYIKDSLYFLLKNKYFVLVLFKSFKFVLSASIIKKLFGPK
jgi:hypothetical protein